MKVDKTGKLVRGIIFVILVAMSLITIFPIVYTIFGSFKPTMEILTSGKLWAVHPTFNNYINAVENIDLLRYSANSLIICVLAVLGTVIVTSMTAYVLTRRSDLPGGKFIMGMYMASMFISLPVVTIYPIFKLLIVLKLNLSLAGQIIVAIGGATYVFMITGYLKGISKEIDEAAYIDGCGFFRTYWQIILPLIRPIIATVALFTFKSTWNSYLMPSILTMGNDELKPLTVAIVELKNSGHAATDTGLMLAGATISIVPIVIMYIIANKNFLNGLSDGAVKG